MDLQPDPDGSMCAQELKNVQDSYDRVAEEYARRIYDELEHKPFDRALLDRFAERVRGWESVCDLGCGPGHVARYLKDRGVQVFGVDLSPGMLEVARQLNPGICFYQGNMLGLDAENNQWDAIVAFYSIIHLPQSELLRVFSEMRRVLRPGGLLLLAFHTGDQILHLDEWWGREVCIDFVFFAKEDVEKAAADAGFEIEEALVREPYPDVEHQSRRAYLLATNTQAR